MSQSRDGPGRIPATRVIGGSSGTRPRERERERESFQQLSRVGGLAAVCGAAPNPLRHWLGSPDPAHH